MTTGPTSRGAIASVRDQHSIVTAALGLVLVFFFVDGFLRDSTPQAAVVLLVLGGFLLVGLMAIAERAAARWIEPRTVVVTLVGTILVGIGGRELGLSAVFSAATVGVVAGLASRFVRRVSDADAAALYVGAFAGMTSPVVLLGPGWLVLAGLITGLLWSIVREAWVGVGGKMGTVTFAGVALTALLSLALGTGASHTSPPQYAPALELAVLGTSIASALLTHWLAYSRSWGPVLGSAAPSAIVFAVFVGVSQAVALPNDALAAAWFGASFVGMTARARTGGSWWLVGAMAATFGALLVLFQAHLAGLGGDLGATASAAVIAVIGARTLVQRLSRLHRHRRHR